MPSINKRPDGRWRARYRDDAGKEHARHFERKSAGQRWLNEVTASVVTGTYVDPKTAKTTVAEWCTAWLRGYESKRPSTVRQARTHLTHILEAFGGRALADVRPSEVRAWTASLKAAGYADSTVYALHARLSQIFSDAVHDGLIPKSPVSRRTSPGGGKQRPYVATTEQVWALHDAMPESMRPAILLAAFAGLRVAEVAALRTVDVDFMRGVVAPKLQYPAEPLKTEMSKTPISIPRELALQLNHNPSKWGSDTIVTGSGGARSRRTRSRRTSAGPVSRLRACPRGSASMTCGTTSRRCSSLRASTSRWCRHASGTRPRRPRWTPTGTSGRTKTSPHELPSRWFWLLVRTLCGPRPLLPSAGARRRSRARSHEGMLGGVGLV